MLHPLLLIALHLTSEQEEALRRLYGDAVLPGAVAVGARGQTKVDVVAVVPVPQEGLAFGEGVLKERGGK